VNEDLPDRSFVVLGGRTTHHHALDPVSLLVTEHGDLAGLGLEEAAIVRLCSSPQAVVEIAGTLRVPLGMANVLISGLLDQGRLTVRNPPSVAASSPDVALLNRVVVGLRNL
jgi:hypothetical protein